MTQEEIRARIQRLKEEACCYRQASSLLAAEACDRDAEALRQQLLHQEPIPYPNQSSERLAG